MKRFFFFSILTLTLVCSCKNNDRNNNRGLNLVDFPTMQQSTDYTCGCMAARMVLEYYGAENESEEILATKMHTHVDGCQADSKPGSAWRLTDFGTSVEELWQYFHNREDFSIVASSYCPDCSPTLLSDTAVVGIQAVGNVQPQFADYSDAAKFFSEHLHQHRPIMVCWNMWGGHWTVCIGYDDNGTPDFYDDDILTMADPYDSTDGITDGTTRVGLVQFFYDWFCIMTPKPWQLQPYLIVDTI